MQVGLPKAAGNLRERLSSFVGRDAELEQLREALRCSRLVTLTAPGGAGKTRLAVEAAAALREEHRNGAWLVELASVAKAGELRPPRRARWRRLPSRALSLRDRRRSSSCGTWPAGRWSSSWTTASTSSARRPRWPTPCSERCPASG
jgi:AAA ATPase-like protein